MPDPPPNRSLPKKLTARELDVVRHLVAGESNREIAVALNISSRTVQSHVANAMSKTEAKSRTHLVALVLHAGLVPLDAVSGRRPGDAAS